MPGLLMLSGEASREINGYHHHQSPGRRSEMVHTMQHCSSSQAELPELIR